MALKAIDKPIYHLITTDTNTQAAAHYTAVDDADLQKKIADLPKTENVNMLFAGIQMKMKKVTTVEVSE